MEDKLFYISFIIFISFLYKKVRSNLDLKIILLLLLKKENFSRSSYFIYHINIYHHNIIIITFLFLWTKFRTKFSRSKTISSNNFLTGEKKSKRPLRTKRHNVIQTLAEQLQNKGSKKKKRKKKRTRQETRS